MSGFDLQGVALFTGAASGMGRACAILFAQEGCTKMAIADLDAKGLAETKRLVEAEASKVEVLVVPTDVSKEEAVQQMVDQTVERFGRLDYAVNLAGLFRAGGMHETTTADFDLLMSVNTRGLYFCERTEIRQMLKQEPLPTKLSKHPVRGAIVNISSTSGLQPTPGAVIYNMTKFAVTGLTRSDGQRYAGDKIRVCSVHPGVTSTAMLKDTPETGLMSLETMAKNVPAQRLADPEEIANAVLFLCSARASYMFGSTVTVSGGLKV